MQFRKGIAEPQTKSQPQIKATDISNLINNTQNTDLLDTIKSKLDANFYTGISLTDKAKLHESIIDKKVEISDTISKSQKKPS